MYINDVHIIYYLIIAIIGGVIGQCLKYACLRLEEEKSVLSLDFFKRDKMQKKTNYLLIVIMAAIYVIILYTCKIQFDIIKDLRLIKYLILAPMLVCAFIIDYKKQIIPNRLTLSIFEIGLIFTFIYGAFVDLELAKDMLLGMLVGGGIFLVITLLGGALAGKEAMGFGDVKLMGAMGLFFGVINIAIVSAIAFLLGAVISVILLLTKKKKSDEYIPFGPFIVIAAFIVMCVPSSILFVVLFKIFSLGLYNA